MSERLPEAMRAPLADPIALSRDIRLRPLLNVRAGESVLLDVASTGGKVTTACLGHKTPTLDAALALALAPALALALALALTLALPPALRSRPPASTTRWRPHQPGASPQL